MSQRHGRGKSFLVLNPCAGSYCDHVFPHPILLIQNWKSPVNGSRWFSEAMEGLCRPQKSCLVPFKDDFRFLVKTRVTLFLSELHSEARRGHGRMGTSVSSEHEGPGKLRI